MNNYLQFPFISFHSSNSRSKHNLASHYHETKNYYLRFKVYAYLLRDKILFCGKKIQIVVKMLLCETSLSGVEKERSKTNQKQAKLVLRHNMRYISLMRAELHKKMFNYITRQQWEKLEPKLQGTILHSWSAYLPFESSFLEMDLLIPYEAEACHCL